jgi:hypothetical protein
MADGLKAAEMLAKMCGWNEPEKVNVQSVEVKVDAALIEQLRAATHPSARLHLPKRKGSPAALIIGTPNNIISSSLKLEREAIDLPNYFGAEDIGNVVCQCNNAGCIPTAVSDLNFLTRM